MRIQAILPKCGAISINCLITAGAAEVVAIATKSVGRSDPESGPETKDFLNYSAFGTADPLLVQM